METSSGKKLKKFKIVREVHYFTVEDEIYIVEANTLEEAKEKVLKERYDLNATFKCHTPEVLEQKWDEDRCKEIK